MDGLEFVRTYLDDCLSLTSGTWEDRLEKLAQVLVRLKSAGLKVNAQKSFFEQSQLEYKARISREVMLAFPDFSQPFEIYTDASNLQLGAVVAQNNKPIAFFLAS